MSQKTDTALAFGIGILTGVLGGVAAAILLSPKSGEEMRKDLKAVKEIMKSDGESDNMTASDNLLATNVINAKTKNINAKRLAIIYFENSGGENALNKLKKGLADMLITDLSKINMLTIV